MLEVLTTSQYSGNQRREETGPEAKALLADVEQILQPAGLASSSLLGTPARSNPIQRPRKKPSKRKTKKKKKKEKNRESPSLRRTRRSKEQSRHERAHPNPRSSSSRQPPRHAPEQRRRESSPPAGEQRGQFVFGWSPSRFRAPIPIAPLPEVSSIPAVSRIRFGSAGRVVSLAGDPAGTSSPELGGAGDHASIALGFGRVTQLARKAHGLYARFGPAVPLPGRLLDLAAVGAAPAEMRSPPWPASWELGYGLALCRKRRKP